MGLKYAVTLEYVIIICGLHLDNLDHSKIVISKYK